MLKNNDQQSSFGENLPTSIMDKKQLNKISGKQQRVG
jgi:hypothetical protein